MTRTQQRNGNRVWEAALDVSEGMSDTWDGWMTVGEIARQAGVSKPTAAKYLEKAHEAGFLRCFVDRYGMRLYKMYQEG